MARDFREFLEEATRHEKFGRYFKEIGIGFKLVMSIQASALHGSDPAETLDDVYGYKAFEVSVRQSSKPIEAPKIGAWSDLREKTWAAGFDREEYRTDMMKDNVSVDEVQVIFEDLIEYAREKGQLEAGEEPVLLDPEAPIRKFKKGRCTSCGSGK